MDPQDLLMTALKATILYFFLLIIIRMLGKRAVGTSSAFDLLVALMLGEVVDEIVFGDVSMVKGLLAVVVIAAWHLVNAWASHKSDAIDKLTASEPTLLVKDGKIQADGLAKERLNESELLSELRLKNVDDLKEVKTASLEPSGKISVILEEWAKPLEKGDLPEARQA